ncbi:hypothetical protein HMI54_000661 [Coelomomyces lativittatus]|nr:hypothetical protein HMI54_000661 [Coelomomyces lativittatus]
MIFSRQSSWNHDTSPMKVHVIVCKDSISVGDVLRELDNQTWIKSDFILVHGDLVSNLDLVPVLQRHRQRRQHDPDCVMTMVLKQGHVDHRAMGCSSVWVVDPTTDRCVYYVHDVSHVQVPSEVFYSHPSLSPLDVRHDAIDTGIDICTPDVLALFSENFDYQDLRQHFVRGLLESDLFTKHMYVHWIDQEYAVRVQNTRLYDCVSTDMMCRWVYPRVPEATVPPGSTHTKYQYARYHLYREQPVFLARTTQLEKNVVLGHHSQVGEGTSLRNCVIGRYGRIGHHVRLHHTYVFQACQIGNRCQLTSCLLAENVVLGDHVTVSPGCILGKGVKVDAGIVLPPHTKLMKSTYNDVALVGVNGIGCLWQPEEEDEGEMSGGSKEDDVREAPWVNDMGYDSVSLLNQYFSQLALTSTSHPTSLQPSSSSLLPPTSKSILYSSSTSMSSNLVTSHSSPSFFLTPSISSSSSTTLSTTTTTTTTTTSSSSSLSSSSFHLKKCMLPSTVTNVDTENNREEIQLTIQRALEQQHTLENTLLELNTLKFACNLSFKDLRQEVIPCIFDFLLVACAHLPLKPLLETWIPVIQGLIHRFQDQWHAWHTMVQYFQTRVLVQKKISLVAMVCYDLEVIDERVFLKAYDRVLEKKKTNELEASEWEVWKHLVPFLEWLQEADEEEETTETETETETGTEEDEDEDEEEEEDDDDDEEEEEDEDEGEEDEGEEDEEEEEEEREEGLTVKNRLPNGVSSKDEKGMRKPNATFKPPPPWVTSSREVKEKDEEENLNGLSLP